MKHFIAFSFLLLAQFASGQDAWQRLLIVDPYRANGYFIVDEAKCQQMGADRIDVDLVLFDLDNGAYTASVVQTISIIPPVLHGHLNLGLLPTLGAGDAASYHVRAINPSGVVVDEFDRDNGEPPREEICRTTCNSAQYAWALVALEDVLHGNTIINIYEGTAGGEYLYFYVKQSEWGSFTNQFDPQDFGLPPGAFSYPNGIEVMHLDHAESGFHDYLGYTFDNGYTGPCYAIRKDKGPWRELFGATDPLLGNDYCDGANPGLLQAQYNADDDVQFRLAQYNLPNVTCDAALWEGGGGVGAWGAGGNGNCIAFDHSDGSEDADGDGEIDPVGWVSSVIDCPTTVPNIYREEGLSAVSSIQINNWTTATVSPVISIHIPDVDDPRLVPVKRTLLVPGLYEYLVVFDDGNTWRKFQSYDQAVTIKADFASFTDVTVYPVPITNRWFSVDLDLLAPMDITITVINNQGTVFHQRAESFELAGRNKHVISMTNPWPNGLYHVVLQYEDGSSESIGITVQ